MLDQQNQYRLKIVLRTLHEVLELLAERHPTLTKALRSDLMAPTTNLQIDAGIPRDDFVQILP